MTEVFLKEALRLANIQKGNCAPNPSVGAVIVKNNTIISRGYHQGVGTSHAEVMAIEAAKVDLSSSTLYVTLEPCCHFGKTPPCTELIIKSGIKRVVFGFVDPNPHVKGNGQAELQKAQIDAEHISTREIDLFYESYTHWLKTKTPFVTAKLAISLDGKLTKSKGSRTKITGEKLDHWVHEMRQKTDALLTTSTTIKIDDPKLNARTQTGALSKLVYVVDSNLSTPVESQIFSTAKKMTVFHREDADPQKISQLHQRDIRTIPISVEENRLSLGQIISSIGKDGIHDLWCEAGGRLFGSLMKHHLIQRLFLAVSPVWFGDESPAPFEKSEKFSGQMTLETVSAFDNDVLMQWRI